MLYFDHQKKLPWFLDYLLYRIGHESHKRSGSTKSCKANKHGHRTPFHGYSVKCNKCLHVINYFRKWIKKGTLAPRSASEVVVFSSFHNIPNKDCCRRRAIFLRWLYTTRYLSFFELHFQEQLRVLSVESFTTCSIAATQTDSETWFDGFGTW